MERRHGGRRDVARAVASSGGDGYAQLSKRRVRVIDGERVGFLAGLNGGKGGQGCARAAG